MNRSRDSKVRFLHRGRPGFTVVSICRPRNQIFPRAGQVEKDVTAGQPRETSRNDGICSALAASDVFEPKLQNINKRLRTVEGVEETMMPFLV